MLWSWVFRPYLIFRAPCAIVCSLCVTATIQLDLLSLRAAVFVIDGVVEPRSALAKGLSHLMQYLSYQLLVSGYSLFRSIFSQHLV
jgi:hypothetical protein